MRRVVHRILSAVPTVFFAAGGLYATADPIAAKHAFERASDALRNDKTLTWAAAFLICGYIVAWWISSFDPPPKRLKVVHGLQPYYAMTAAHLKSVQDAATDEDASAIFDTLEREQLAACEWIATYIGPAAKKKFVSRSLGSGSFEWMWPGEHSPSMVQRRSNALNALGDRLKNIEQLLNSNSWDRPQIGGWRKLKNAVIRQANLNGR